MTLDGGFLVALDSAWQRATSTDTITVDWAPGSASDPMTRDQLRSKWLDCASHGGMETDDAQVLRLLDAPLPTPASDLLRPLSQALLCAFRNARQRPGRD
jgi:hypothetical protein